MSTTDVRLTVTAGRTAPRHGFLEGTGPVPLVVSALLAVLTMPMFVLAPITIPAGVALLAAGATYLMGVRGMRAGRAGALRTVGIASVGGLLAIGLGWLTSWHLAGRYDAHGAVAPCCAVAFAVPTAVYLVATALVVHRVRRGSR